MKKDPMLRDISSQTKPASIRRIREGSKKLEFFLMNHSQCELIDNVRYIKIVMSAPQAPNAINASNFVLSGSLDPSGMILPFVFFNPPELGPWLHHFCQCDAYVKENGNFTKIAQIPKVSSDLAWPTPHIEYNYFTSRVWAPCVFNSVFKTSIPVIFIEFEAENPITAMFAITGANQEKGKNLLFSSDDFGNQFVLHADNKSTLTGDHLIFAVVAWNDNLFVASKYNSAEDMMSKINFITLKSETFGFETHLPKVKPEHRILMNQEIVAGITLTRTIKSGEIITMGYCELNQRDSYWTSFLHLVCFPQAEVRMIDESCAGQLSTGKIPTTLLPLIEREFDIDITAYFVLRIVRFFRYYKNLPLALKWVKNAYSGILYLKSLLDTNNVPFARDFWADWKDIQGLNDRLYGPHFVLLVKAAIKEYNWLAKQLGLPEDPIEINIDPIWNGRFFVDVTKDGTVDNRFHEDQMIPTMWNVCDQEMYESILQKAEELEGPYGLPETYPFYPPEFGYKQGEYHNGGIWPWVAFADAACRISYGNKESGERILIKVATSDIITFGDLCPNEFINGINGVGQGHFIQGWNACAILPFSLLSDEPRNNLQQYMQDIR